jgi:hypothetical protein
VKCGGNYLYVFVDQDWGVVGLKNKKVKGIERGYCNVMQRKEATAKIGSESNFGASLICLSFSD